MAKKVTDTIAEMKGIMGPMPPPEKEGYDEKNVVDFPIPEGYQLPAGVEPNDEFTALGTFRLKEDGDLCLTKLDGMPVQAEANEA